MGRSNDTSIDHFERNWFNPFRDSHYTLGWLAYEDVVDVNDSQADA
jgi:hypothetical protein